MIKAGNILGGTRPAAQTVATASSRRALLNSAPDVVIPSPGKRKPRAEGTIASVFASLSGESAVPLPSRFSELKRSILATSAIQRAATNTWVDLIEHLNAKTAEIRAKGTAIIPEVHYEELHGGISSSKADEIRAVGTVVVRGVVTEAKAVEWLDSIKEYIALNPHVKGFPENDKAVYEMYWSQAQIEARSHPASLQVQKSLMSLFNKNSAPDDSISTHVPLTYCDRLRIRKPGDAQFALGPHCDGGSVERWEDPLYRSSYKAILDGRWRDHDCWDLGSRARANMSMYDGPGSCGVFRAWQGWTSLSHTSENEGTLKVFPAILESSAYMMLRPFFRPKKLKDELSREAYLSPSNWELNLNRPDFPNSPLGRSQEMNDETHPHLDLDHTMTAIRPVRPGDQAWWHCDGVHSVESAHRGKNASSVMYIPAVPLTLKNLHYIKEQRDSMTARTPPPDFPGGEGESGFVGSGSYPDILTSEGRRAMGFQSFSASAAVNDAERKLLMEANAELGL